MPAGAPAVQGNVSSNHLLILARRGPVVQRPVGVMRKIGKTRMRFHARRRVDERREGILSGGVPTLVNECSHTREMGPVANPHRHATEQVRDCGTKSLQRAVAAVLTA